MRRACVGPAYQGCPTLLLPFVGVGLASPSLIMSAKLCGTSELLAPRRRAPLVVFCVYPLRRQLDLLAYFSQIRFEASIDRQNISVAFLSSKTSTSLYGATTTRYSDSFEV